MQTITPRRRMAQRKGFLLSLLVFVALVTGLVSVWDGTRFDFASLIGNLSTELIGGVLTFILIDRFILKDEDETSQRKILISKLENHDRGIVKQVVQELRANGWLEDGSLYGWFIQRANFEDIPLKQLNTNGLGLFRCNMKGTRLTDAQCLRLEDFRLSIMPDGTLYDGRYCLSGDIEWAQTHYDINFMDASITLMAEYYGVDEDTFVAGQRWALKHLPEHGYDVPPYLQKLASELA